MDFHDYYAELGVPRTATEANIKSAFRKLARECHPDAHPNDTAAEERFKRISEAYEALGDADRRAKYDEVYDEYQRFRTRGGRSGNTSWDAFRQGSPSTPGAGSTDGFFSGSTMADFFEQMFGQRAPGGQRRREDTPPKTIYTVKLTLEEAFIGARKRLSLRGEKLDVTFKPGIASGQRLSIPQGELEVTVAPHPRFTRDGNDLRCSQPVPLSTLLLGGEVTVDTLAKPLTLRIQAGTAIGKSFRVKGQGMPVYGTTNAGDLYVTVVATIAQTLSPEQQEAAELLRSSGL